MNINFARRVIFTGIAIAALQSAAAAADSPARKASVAPVDPYIHRSNFVVADMDRALILYRDILGLKVDVMMPVRSESFMYDVFSVDHAARMRIAFLSSPDNRFGAIGLTEIKGIVLPPPPSSFPSVLIVEIKGRFETVYEQARAAEPKLDVGRVYELQNPSRREFPMTDYDGNRIIIMQLHAADR